MTEDNHTKELEFYRTDIKQKCLTEYREYTGYECINPERFSLGMATSFVKRHELTTSELHELVRIISVCSIFGQERLREIAAAISNF